MAGQVAALVLLEALFLVVLQLLGRETMAAPQTHLTLVVAAVAQVQ